MGRRRSSAGRGRLRIIAGQWRGRRVAFPDTAGLRPTPDRVRETLFNWLAPYIAGARVLDLYAGSGILGLEALSRGAASVLAVERDRAVAEQLRASAQALEAVNLEVLVMDARRFLDRAAGDAFDIVFLDPPHADADYEHLCRRVAERAVVAAQGFVYLEYAAPRASALRAPCGWTCYRSATAGHLAYQLWTPSRTVSESA